MRTPAMPTDERERLAELRRLNLLLTTPEEPLDWVTRELAEIFDVPGAFISFIDEDTHYYKSEVGLAEELKATRSEARTSESPCTYIVETNEPLVIEDMTMSERFRDTPAVRQYGVRFYAGAPLRGPGGHAVGSLCIIDQRARSMSERERRLLDLLAAGVMAQTRLQNASRQLAERTAEIERDLLEAGRVQRFLLPEPRLAGDGWVVEHLYHPVEHLGGDLVDVQRRPDGAWAVLIADVSGHGTSAALTSMMTKTAFLRAVASHDSPGAMLEAMNRDLAAVAPPHRFVTAQIVTLDASRPRAALASAGHPYPILRHTAGARVVETDSGPPLIVAPDTVYPDVTLDHLPAGDTLLLYTDGVIEAGDSAAHHFGVDRLRRILADPADPRAIHLADVFAAVSQHARHRLADDVALVLIRRV